MIFIQPTFFFPCQEGHIDELPAIRHHRNMLKSQIRLVPEFVLSFDLLYNDNIFYPDAKISVFIVSGLIRDYVTGCQGDF